MKLIIRVFHLQNLSQIKETTSRFNALNIVLSTSIQRNDVTHCSLSTVNELKMLMYS